MKIFNEDHLGAYLERRLNSCRKVVQQENHNRLLNMDEDQYIDYLASKYHVDPLDIHPDKARVSSHEEMIPAHRFPKHFDVHDGKSYPKQVITYHLPFSGNEELLRLMPSSRILWTMEVQIKGRDICFDITNWRDNPEEIKRRADEDLRSIMQQAGNVAKEITVWNEQLTDRIRSEVQGRKEQLLRQSKLLENLGVPIQRAEDVPQTFAIPITKKQPIIQKPSAPGTSFTPEPALAPEMYEYILTICHDMGMEIERHPSIYTGKDEETLRDHFVMQLSPHFQSVSGETFNKSGKTDILIRHEGENVFVAECKFWKGGKSFLKSIDQLLGYLTWRDSKTAILIFVQNKELQPVLSQVGQYASEHPCFVKHKGKKSESRFDFRFHLPDDPSRGVDVAVLCFHFPPSTTQQIET